MAKQILRNTETISAIKFWGSNSVETVNLQTDLIIPNRLVLDGSTQLVNIMSFTWAGEVDSYCVVKRGTTPIITLDGANAASLVFDNMLFNDTVANDTNITVELYGDISLYLVLRKASGYKVTFEPGPYGIYDDPTIVGPKV